MLKAGELSRRLHCAPVDVVSDYAEVSELYAGDFYESGRTGFYRRNAGFNRIRLDDMYYQGPVHSLVLWEVEPECWDPTNPDSEPKEVSEDVRDLLVATHLGAPYYGNLGEKIEGIESCLVAGAGVWEFLEGGQRGFSFYLSLALACPGAITVDDYLKWESSEDSSDADDSGGDIYVEEVKSPDPSSGGTGTVILIFACTGSMRPTITCRDSATATRDFTASQVSVGSIAVFSPSSCSAMRGGRGIAHRVIEKELRDGTWYFRFQGDANTNPDPCWFPFSAINYLILQVNKGGNDTEQTRIEDELMRPYREALDRAETEMRRALKAYRDAYFLYCGFYPTSGRRCTLAPGPYALVVGLYQAYSSAYDAYIRAYNEYRVAADRYT